MSEVWSRWCDIRAGASTLRLSGLIMKKTRSTTLRRAWPSSEFSDRASDRTRSRSEKDYRLHKHYPKHFISHCPRGFMITGQLSLRFNGRSGTLLMCASDFTVILHFVCFEWMTFTRFKAMRWLCLLHYRCRSAIFSICSTRFEHAIVCVSVSRVLLHLELVAWLLHVLRTLGLIWNLFAFGI